MAARLAFVAASLALVFACGAASAQDDGAVCRSFCDVDAKQCRKTSDQEVDKEHHPWLPLVTPGVPGAYGSWDFGNEKAVLADKRETDERFKGSQACGDARQACRQKCAAPAAAASAP